MIGFIAAHMIQLLLEDGYTVNATVRSTKEEAKYQFLKQLPQKVRVPLDQLRISLF